MPPEAVARNINPCGKKSPERGVGMGEKWGKRGREGGKMGDDGGRIRNAIKEEKKCSRRALSKNGEQWSGSDTLKPN